MLEQRIGAFVEKGQLLCTIYANDERHVKEVQPLLLDAIKIGSDNVPKTKLVLGTVDIFGFQGI